jgi:hypothetical protein
MSAQLFFCDLRSSILEAMTGVKNASGYGWDTTRPNYLIKSRLQGVYDSFLPRAAEFGFHIVRRHSECGEPGHETDDNFGYVMENLDGQPLHFGKMREDGAQFIWKGPIEQGDVNISCPCTMSAEPREHYVLYDIFLDTKKNVVVYEAIEQTYNKLSSAINHASDKRPRSAIREQLLEAILRLNDAILDEPMSKKAARILETGD